MTRSAPWCSPVPIRRSARVWTSSRRRASRHGLLRAGSRTKNCMDAIAELRKPVVGAINGATFTGGLEIALGCDFLVASERAVFADTHARVGILPGGGMTARLPRWSAPGWHDDCR